MPAVQHWTTGQVRAPPASGGAARTESWVLSVPSLAAGLAESSWLTCTIFATKTQCRGRPDGRSTAAAQLGHCR